MTLRALDCEPSRDENNQAGEQEAEPISLLGTFTKKYPKPMKVVRCVMGWLGFGPDARRHRSAHGLA